MMSVVCKDSFWPGTLPSLSCHWGMHHASKSRKLAKVRSTSEWSADKLSVPVFHALVLVPCRKDTWRDRSCSRKLRSLRLHRGPYLRLLRLRKIKDAWARTWPSGYDRDGASFVDCCRPTRPASGSWVVRGSLRPLQSSYLHSPFTSSRPHNKKGKSDTCSQQRWASKELRV